jgi:hypothetical protein
VPRILFCCAALAVFVLSCRADEPTSGSETLIRLRVSPAAAAQPALRYQLLPELAEMNPGNPVQNYMKCFMEQQKFFFDKASFERREKLLAMPLKELPAQDVLDSGELPLSQADWAARLDAPDWQVLLKAKTDGVTLLVPDVQEIRSLAKPLKLRFRAEVACGRFDLGIRTAKTMFAMAQHLGEHPTLIATLVGILMANAAIDPLEEMLEQPGCPNLYWALTKLPTPLVSAEKGAQGERLWIAVEFRGLDEIAPMTADQLDRFAAHVDKLLGAEKPFAPGQGIRGAVEAQVKAEGKLSAARRRLIEFGFAEERLLHFPPEQIVLLDEKREYQVRRDDILKLMSLPMSQAAVLAAGAKPAAEPPLFAHRLVEGLQRVSWKQGKLDQRIALLRHVEAIRMYAAAHNGALPARLSDVPVPLPDDPFTGKRFQYEQTGGTAHIRATAPGDNDNDPPFRIHYELTIRQ